MYSRRKLCPQEDDLRKSQQGPWKWLETVQGEGVCSGDHICRPGWEGFWWALLLGSLHPTGRGTVKRGCQASQLDCPGLREALLWSTRSTGGWHLTLKRGLHICILQNFPWWLAPSSLHRSLTQDSWAALREPWKVFPSCDSPSKSNTLIGYFWALSQLVRNPMDQSQTFTHFH